MRKGDMDLLVSTEWLAAELGGRDLSIVDATLLAGDLGRDARAEFEAAHIPGAVFLDLASLVDGASPLPNTLPGAESFAGRAEALGIGDTGRIVLYDNSPWHSSARAWFMFQLFGANEVAILDGGWRKWTAEGWPVEAGRAEARGGRHFAAWKDQSRLRTLDQVRANLKTHAAEVVDARSAGRFRGEEPEGRDGVRPGHIPGSLNVPLGKLLNEDGTWKQGGALAGAFREAGVDLGRPVITTCGSGITASGLAFGLALLGKEDVALYDGSWTEWGSDPDTPVETGGA